MNVPLSILSVRHPDSVALIIITLFAFDKYLTQCETLKISNICIFIKDAKKEEEYTTSLYVVM